MAVAAVVVVGGERVAQSGGEVRQRPGGLPGAVGEGGQQGDAGFLEEGRGVYAGLGAGLLLHEQGELLVPVPATAPAFLLVLCQGAEEPLRGVRDLLHLGELGGLFQVHASGCGLPERGVI
ncbi:hypothetical protein OG613_46940 (plasmid) [Streptomyces sp. NBC_00015]|uniref:hypothetical protein n=1 Tax=Streptomyces sp. NBC_00015 TaxID=2903611 RepID=UPI00324459A8